MFRLAAGCAERCVNRERGLLAFRMAGTGMAKDRNGSRARIACGSGFFRLIVAQR